MTEMYEGREPVMRRTHDHPWAADLETEEHAADRSFVIEESIDAIEQTREGQFVDLITHKEHGHPSAYLYPELRLMDSVIEFVDKGRCSCGGYITRIWIEHTGSSVFS